MLPPDFIFNLGYQVIGIFSIIFIALSAFFSLLYNFFRLRIKKHLSKLNFFIAVIFIFSISYFSVYYYENFQQNKNNNQWLEKSQKERDLIQSSAFSKTKNEDEFYEEENKKYTEKNYSNKNDFENYDLKWDYFTNIKEDHEPGEELAYSLADFKKIFDEGEDLFILDVREAMENERKEVPGSVNIRLADLTDGEEWKNLPRDKIIYILCWSGNDRSREAASFLKERDFDAVYLYGGFNDWESMGGNWLLGENDNKIIEDKYRETINASELKNILKKDILVLDTRPKELFDFWRIPGSKNISFLNTPTSELETTIEGVLDDRPFTVLCDDTYSCIDAQFIATELAGRDMEFLGIFNQPWEIYDSF